MCGRYILLNDQEQEEIGKIIREVSQKYPNRPFCTGEVFPKNTAPVLLTEGNRWVPELLVWGFPGYQGKDLIINGRAETAAEKPTFRESLFTRRCIIPCTGFYEWDADKRKYLLYLPGEKILYLAGICKEYSGVLRYVILTTKANASVKGIHNRMPVILTPDQMEMWGWEKDASLQYLHGEMPSLSYAAV